MSATAGDRELYVGLYRRMRLIRGVEDLIQSLFLRGEVYGTTHLYSGQEAVAVGFASVLSEHDRVAATYRGHGHALALGVDPQKLLDEMLGRATGINGGLAGSMNVTSPPDRLIGSFGIVGGSIAAATGAALALKRTGGVAVAYFGDGAMNQGYFFECLNFCKVLGLPIVLVCENNGYGEYTPFEEVTAGPIRARAEVMEVPAETIDGMEVWTVREAAQRATEHARSGGGPYFVEAITYRFVGHSRSDPGSYRPDGRARPLAGARPARRAPIPARGRGNGAGVLDELEASVAEQLSRWRSAGSPRRSPSHVSSRSSRPDGARARDAEAVGLERGVGIVKLAEGRGRAVRSRRAARRDRDRQGDGHLRGRDRRCDREHCRGARAAPPGPASRSRPSTASGARGRPLALPRRRLLRRRATEAGASTSGRPCARRSTRRSPPTSG